MKHLFIITILFLGMKSTIAQKINSNNETLTIEFEATPDELNSSFYMSNLEHKEYQKRGESNRLSLTFLKKDMFLKNVVVSFLVAFPIKGLDKEIDGNHGFFTKGDVFFTLVDRKIKTYKRLKDNYVFQIRNSIEYLAINTSSGEKGVLVVVFDSELKKVINLYFLNTQGKWVYKWTAVS